MFNAKLQWHPKFIRHTLDNGDALLLSETDQYFITNDELFLLDKVIQGNGFLSDFIFACDDIVKQVQRMQKIDDHIEKNILTNKFSDIENQYIIPGFNNIIDPIVIDTSPVYYLSEQIYSSAMLSYYIDIAGEIPIAVVIVDDLLDPRLISLNNKFLRQKKRWLLLKPTGEAPSIGPIFSPYEKNAPCYQCLLIRLTQNNPVREWLRRKNNMSTFLPTSIFSNKGKIESVFESFKSFFNKDFSSVNGLLYSYVGMDKEWMLHPVQHRPQCPGCGDPTLMDERHTQPIQLQDCFRNQNFDGGYRVNNPSTTLAKLTQFISPITGVLSDFNEITPETTEQQLSIYRAVYFQNTYSTKPPTADTFVQLSLGKGISKNQAMVSALGEAMERQAAQYNGEEATIFSSENDLPGRAIAPSVLTPFSLEQYQYFARFDGPTLLQPQWLAKHEKNTPLHWLQGWSLTSNELVYFPAAYCLANTPFSDHIYSLYSHNGNAAGTTQEEAILQGVLELIERDAVAIWWYNQIPRPEISFDIIPDEYRSIIAETLNPEWHYWLLDLTHDIDVTTCVAVGQHKLTDKFVMGFGCHLQPAIAAQRALTEMYQLIAIKDKVTGPFDFDQLSAHPFLKPKRKTPKKNFGDFREHSQPNIKDDILFIMDLLKKSGLELCAINYSRPDLPLQTLKIIVPGLCHFWPQFGNARLYQVPVDLGWLSKPLKECELNPMDLYL